jgi:maltooligosyltrehalose trehalohydrolase
VLLLTSPFTPMLWMGEEWAAATRWPFFTSHPEPELAEATGRGRLAEFGDHGWDTSQMIDPQDPAAYRGAILDWDELVDPAHRSMLELYRALIALRAAEPDLRDADLTRVHVDYDEDERWILVHRGGFLVVANLSGEPRVVPVAAGAVVIATGTVALGAGSVAMGPESAAVLER